MWRPTSSPAMANTDRLGDESAANFCSLAEDAILQYGRSLTADYCPRAEESSWTAQSCPWMKHSARIDPRDVDTLGHVRLPRVNDHNTASFQFLESVFQFSTHFPHLTFAQPLNARTGCCGRER